MRITFVMPTLEVSGGANIVVGHAERLAEKGHDVLIMAPRPHPLTLKQKIKRLMGRDILRTPTSKASIMRSTVPTRFPDHLHKIVESDVPDADCIVATWWETAEWMADFAPEKGSKFHFIQHYEGFPPMPADRVDATWKLPFHKIAIAQWLIDLGRDRFQVGDIALVPNGLDDRFRVASRRNRGKVPTTVGFLYHTADFKDYPTTRAAIEKVRQAKPDVRLLSFGAMIPPRDALPADVEFHHLPSQEAIADIYARCDVWLSTSRTEGFNLPPLEAMAGGCPAVCGKTGRPFEIIKDGINGYLVDAGDVDGFAAAVTKVLDLSDEAWAEMSEAARAAVAHPTWEESSELFEVALLRGVGADRIHSGAAAS